MPEYEVNWHHRILHETLDKFSRKEILRLMVFMPPRHGKSQIVSKHLPAFLFGRNPDARIISASYSAELSSQFNRELQRIIDTEKYREVFPDVALFGKNVRTSAFGNYIRTSEMFEIVNRKGFYRSTGVGGGITGLGADFIIVDDPIKNAQEAYSARLRQAIYEWYTSTLYTRLEKNGSVLITLTRWHEDDLAGRILAASAPDEWYILRFPAICELPKHELDPREESEALWNGKYPLKSLYDIRQTVGATVFSALYQQRPMPASGGIFKRQHFRYFVEEEEYYSLDGDKRYLKVDCILYAIADLAVSTKQTSDYTVIGVFARTPNNEILLLEVIRSRFEGADHGRLIESVFSKYKIAFMGVEAVAYQLSLVQMVQKWGYPVKELRPDKDKVARAVPASIRVETGGVYFKANAPWLDDFEYELTSFPFGTNDDQVDVLSYAVEESSSIDSFYTPTVTRLRRDSSFLNGY